MFGPQRTGFEPHTVQGWMTVRKYYCHASGNRCLLSGYIPLNKWKKLTIGLFTAFDALPPHPPYPLPELGGVLGSADVYEQVSKEGDLDVQFADHLKEEVYERKFRGKFF